MQKFKSSKNAIGNQLGQYDEVLLCKNEADAQDTAFQLNTWHTEANAIMVGDKYAVGLRFYKQAPHSGKGIQK